MIPSVAAALKNVAIIGQDGDKTFSRSSPPDQLFSGPFFVVDETGEAWPMDIVQEVRTRTETKPTAFPVEVGMPISDGVAVGSKTVSLSCVVTNVSRPMPSGKMFADSAWEAIKRIQSERLFCTLWLPLPRGGGVETMSSMILSSVERNRATNTFDGLFLSMTFEEVKVVSTTTTTAPKIIRMEKEGASGKNKKKAKREKKEKKTVNEDIRASLMALYEETRRGSTEKTDATLTKDFSSKNFGGVKWP